LRIAPPEAPVTGYMFGKVLLLINLYYYKKGVYFADMVSKSANYCGASKENNEALILLCDVALGEFNDKYYADYNANLLPAGKHRFNYINK
jgi:poly [ADP-ribose] polymerase